MLKKENRLSSIVAHAKNRASSPLFSLSFDKNDLGLSRFSFVISKKIDKRAVVRNEAKRRVRSVIEEVLDKVEGGRDFAFYLKKEVVGKTRDEIRAEIIKIFEENKLLK